MKYLAINFFLLIFILILSGCGTVTVANDYATITKISLSDEIITYLKSRSSRIETCDNGSFKIYNSAEARDALIRALDILHTQITLIANNIANIETTRAKPGEPYRRQFVKFNEDGTTSIENDMSDFIRVYKPGHPDADGDGMVKKPNINLTIEMVDMNCTTCQIYLLKEVLERFDKTFVNNRQSDRQIQTVYNILIKDQQTRSYNDVVLDVLASILKSRKKEPEPTQVLLFRQAGK